MMLPLLSMLAMVVPPYLNSNLPPDSTMLKLVVATEPALPVVFWFKVGNVQFAKLPEVGVPKMGVTKVGLVERTLLPEPVDVVTPVPPLATGKVPVTCVVKLTFESEPPSVRLPVDVTVPVKVMPLTVPVPLTEVTVPVPGAAALMVWLGQVPVMVTLEPATKAGVVVPVPPLATGKVPVTSDVRLIVEVLTLTKSEPFQATKVL